MTELQSERVRLVAATAATLDAEDISAQAIADLLGVPVPAAWPPEHNDAGTRSWVRQQLAAYPADAAWYSWYIIAREAPALVGTGGYKGPPGPGGEVEIGYSVLPAFQRRGLGTEACRLLSAHAFADPRASAIIAHTLPSLIPSQRLLGKLGFVKVAEMDDPDDGRVWRYRVERGR